MFGLSGDTAHAILAADAARVRRPVAMERPTDALIENHPCRFVRVHPIQYRQHLGFARWYYLGDAFPLLQLAWPSRSGLFPWDARVTDEFRSAQPLIGEAPADAR